MNNRTLIEEAAQFVLKEDRERNARELAGMVAAFYRTLLEYKVDMGTVQMCTMAYQNWMLYT